MTPKEKLQAHSAEFKRDLIKITETITFAVGYGASNVTIIEGDNSLIVVDTLESTGAAKELLADLRQQSSKPIDTIIFTHSHRDHVSGATVFAEGRSPKIMARPAETNMLGAAEVGQISKKRARRQFAIGEPEWVRINLGLGPGERSLEGLGAGALPANTIIVDEDETHVIDGVTLRFIAAPGETPDTMLVWLADERILISGDNYYKSFPNLYPIRGSAYRDVALWVDSLNKMLSFEAEILLPGHTRPLHGADTIKVVLGDYRDGIEHVLTETLAGINAGMTMDELAESISLPDHLLDNPYLQEYYGCIAWSARAIFTGYLGWFDGNPTNMFPLPAREEAAEMAALAGGSDALLQRAEQAISDGKQQWAMQLADHLLALDEHSERATEIKISAMSELAEHQVNATARNYYLSYASELRRAL